MVFHVLQPSQRLLFLYRPYHREAVPVLEEEPDHSPDSILLFDGIATPFLLLEGVLQVLLLVNSVTIVVEQAQTEVANHPQEGREVLLQLLWVLVAELTLLLDLQLLGEVYHQTKRVDSGLVDRVH